MRAICLIALMLPPLISAQERAAIYKERCASCHDMPSGRVPALAAIRAMSPEAIYSALTSGVMKTQAGLSISRIFALISCIASLAARTRQSLLLFRPAKITTLFHLQQTRYAKTHHNGGMLFGNSGYGQWGGMPGNLLLLAFSANGK
jgi:hypothetical protein